MKFFSLMIVELSMEGENTVQKDVCIKEQQKRRSKWVTTKCAVCGTPIEKPQSQIKSKYQFCSRDCAYKGRSIGIVKRTINKPYNCKRKQPKQCIICGSDFIYRKKSQKHCSRKCFETSHRDNMRGKKNPFYIDGRSKNKCSYRGDDWEQIRLEVYRRDNFTCQLCKKKCKNKEIQAHHITKYRITKDNSMDNLVTLCNVCHAKVEYNPKILNKERYPIQSALPLP